MTEAKSKKEQKQADRPVLKRRGKRYGFYVTLSGKLLELFEAEYCEKQPSKPQSIVIDALKDRYNLELV